MNEIVKVLCERRSVRKYLDKEVPMDILKEILKCGTYAPSGKNRQSAKIVVVRNREMINKIGKINAGIMGVDVDPFYGANTLLIVFADKQTFTYLQDGSAVIMNMLNAAYGLGVDSCWIHRAKETFETDEGKEIMQKWGLDDNYEGIGNVILGYRDGELPKPLPRKEDYIIFD